MTADHAAAVEALASCFIQTGVYLDAAEDPPVGLSTPETYATGLLGAILANPDYRAALLAVLIDEDTLAAIFAYGVDPDHYWYGKRTARDWAADCLSVWQFARLTETKP